MIASTLQAMKLAPRWLLRKGKVPYYAENCSLRSTTDTPEDQKRLVTYAEASRFLAIHNETNPGSNYELGFALGPDSSGGHWQGIDLDHVTDKCLLDLKVQLLGYVELSPSGEGVHSIGYGDRFETLGSNTSGIEAYAEGRYFTFTGNLLCDGPLVDLATLVRELLVPRHSSSSQRQRWDVDSDETGSRTASKEATSQELSDLREALVSLNSDDRHLYVSGVGMALKTLPDDKGKEIWLEWSKRSHKFDSSVAEKDWASFKPTSTHWRYVFTLARKAGWGGSYNALPHTDEPVDFLTTTTPIGFDPEVCLPKVIANWVKVHAKASGHQAVGFAFAALPVMAAATNRSVRINLGSGHNTPIILWAALVGATGSGKSPAMSAAHRPLSRLHAAEARQVQQAQAEWANQPRRDRTPEQPTFRGIRYSADTTTEAITLNLSRSTGPRMLVHYDEGSGWLNDMGRYSSGGDGDRATYLSSWLGLQDYVVSRVGRGESIIAELGVNILFGITPHKIHEGYKEASAEGLLGRTLICLVERKQHSNVGRSIDALLALADEEYSKTIESFTRINDVEISLTIEAQSIYDVERSRLGDQSAALESTSPGIAAMLAKAAENMARLAGLFTLCNPPDPHLGNLSLRQHWTIGVPEMTMAKEFLTVATSHAVAAYTGLLIADEVTTIARSCALKILRFQQSRPNVSEISRDEFMKVPAFKAADKWAQSSALELLGTYHWLVENITQRNRSGGNRFGEGARWRINPVVFDGRFSVQAQQSTAEAQKVRRMLLELGAPAAR